MTNDLFVHNNAPQFNRSGGEGGGHMASHNSEHNYPKQLVGRGSEGPGLHVTP